jgi:hypothetical protein
MERNMNANTPVSSKFGTFEALAPVADALEGVLNVEARGKARSFVKRIGEAGEKWAAAGLATVEKATTTAESALVGSVREYARASRAVEAALFQEAEALFVNLNKLSSATSTAEVFHIQADFLRTRGEAAARRINAIADYVDQMAPERGGPASVKLPQTPEMSKAA